MSARAALSLVAALTFLTPQGATADSPPPEAEQKPVSAFGLDNPSCREWTDGCRVCAQRKDGSPACSTVGIACVSGPTACIRSGN